MRLLEWDAHEFHPESFNFMVVPEVSGRRHHKSIPVIVCKLQSLNEREKSINTSVTTEIGLRLNHINLINICYRRAASASIGSKHICLHLLYFCCYCLIDYASRNFSHLFLIKHCIHGPPLFYLRED